MPLSLQGARLETVHKLLTHPTLAEACQSFLEGPHITTDAQLPSICLLQGEQVTVCSKSLPGLLIGSQDATTCLIAVIWCPEAQYVWAAHIDQNLGPADITSISNALKCMQQPQLYLCGGYCNAGNRGPATALAFLQVLHSMDEHEVQLLLSCIGPANTAADGSPRSRQMVLDTSKSSVHPWLFSDRGPQLPRRFAAQHCRYINAGAWQCGLLQFCPMFFVDRMASCKQNTWSRNVVQAIDGLQHAHTDGYHITPAATASLCGTTSCLPCIKCIAKRHQRYPCPYCYVCDFNGTMFAACSDLLLAGNPGVP